LAFTWFKGDWRERRCCAMAVLSSDTAPDVEEMQIERLRGMSVSRKLALVGQMNRAVKDLALAGLRQRYPDDTPDQRRRRLATLLLGSELATRVYGAAPREA
jgi:hypothetical protein